MPKELRLETLDLAAFIRPGDTVLWGQATAEPLPLTQALMAQRHAIGPFNVFLGINYSDTIKQNDKISIGKLMEAMESR